MKKMLDKDKRKKPTKVEDVSNQPKSPDDILNEQVRTGMEQYERNNWHLFNSSFAAGMEVGFSLFLMGILYTLLHDKIDDSFLHIFVALAYSVGFIFVVIGRSELFTEHTTLAVLPVLKGMEPIKSLLRVWAIIYLGNLLGSYLFSFIFTTIGPPMNIISKEAFLHLAKGMISFEWYLILGSSILAGWLMGLLSWLVTSSQETISRIFIVSVITILIGIGGLHHAIAGSIEVFAGMITSAEVTVWDYLNFQFWTTIGNIIGGVVFVAVMKYSTVD